MLPWGTGRGRRASAGAYHRVKGPNVWLKYHAGWVRPEQLPAPLVPGQPPWWGAVSGMPERVGRIQRNPLSETWYKT